jgi:spermidine synthase
MKKAKLIDQATLPSGEVLTLSEEGGFYMVSADGLPLMSNRAHYSEEYMAVIGCEHIKTKKDARVLVGGLGMGYTARSALNQVTETATVVVSEISPQLVEWNRGPLADLAERPLEDPRCELALGDIVAYLLAGPEPFDAMLLDCDHGPDSFTAEGNERLYSRKGLVRLHKLLRPHGVLVIWSAYQVPAFPKALQRAGFMADTYRVRSRGDKGGKHALYIGRKRS